MTWIGRHKFDHSDRTREIETHPNASPNEPPICGGPSHNPHEPVSAQAEQPTHQDSEYVCPKCNSRWYCAHGETK